MIKGTVVSDASPIISLERIPNGHSYLSILFDKVIVPDEVMFEIYRKHYPSTEAYIKNFQLEDIIEVRKVAVDESLLGIDTFRKVTTSPHVSPFKGEAYAMTLASQLNIPLLVDDDQAAKGAFRMGLKIRDIGFQALEIFKRGIITQTIASTIIEQLHNANVYDEKRKDFLLNLLP